MTEDSTARPRLRFAPAPTGYLHLGGARTALFNWLYARRNGGTFVLRIEDTDLERSTEESAAQVLAGLKWLGITWDEGPEVGGPCGPYYQSQRREMHLDHVRRLLESGDAYKCYMTTEELEARRQTAIAEGRPFRYEGWHRDLTSDQIASFEADGRKPAIRLRVNPPAEGYIVDDLIKGATHFPAEQVDDFVLVRSDGTPSFHLANVADDAGMKITHVIRGEDHLTNTIKHQILFERIGAPAPRYGHVPMILGPDRSKLSKRHGAVSVLEYRDKGYLPDAMINELALLGWSSADGKEELSREELIERFDIDRCGRSGSIFDFAKLDHFNRIRIQAMSPAELKAAVAPFAGPLASLSDEKLEQTLLLVRDDCEKLTDFAPAARHFLDEPSGDDEKPTDDALAEAPRVIGAALEHFARLPEPWDRATVKPHLNALGKELGIKGKGLFMPVRVSLTGTLHGPALDGIIAILGRETCLARMRRWLNQIASGEATLG